MNDGGSWGSSCATGAGTWSGRNWVCRPSGGAARRGCAVRRWPPSPPSASPGTRGWNRAGRSTPPARSSRPSRGCFNLTAAENVVSAGPGRLRARSARGRRPDRAGARPRAAAAGLPGLPGLRRRPGLGDRRLEPRLRRTVFAHRGRGPGRQEPALADFHGPSPARDAARTGKRPRAILLPNSAPRQELGSAPRPTRR